MAVGQTMPNLNVPIVSKFLIICPPMDVQKEYYSFVEQTDKSKLAVKQILEKFLNKVGGLNVYLPNTRLSHAIISTKWTPRKAVMKGRTSKVLETLWSVP